MSGRGAQALPGGYAVGEKVFYTGSNQTVSTGDKLVHGQQGVVLGHTILKGKGVVVLYPGNKGNIACLIDQVRRLRAVAAANPTPAPHTSDVPA